MPGSNPVCSPDKSGTSNLDTRPTFNDFYSFPNRVCLDIKAFTVTIRSLE